MPLNGAKFKKAGTISVTGGTDVTLTTDGLTIQNGLHLIDASEANFLARTNVTLKYRAPKFANGVYAKEKKVIVLQIPEVLSDGTIGLDLIRIEREVHPLSTAGKGSALNCAAAQILSGADFTAFWSVGSMA